MADESDPMAASGSSAQPEPSAAAPAPEPPAASEPAPQRESLVDAIADLLQMLVNWLRAEAADLVHDKLVLPIQQLGLTLASASAAGCLLVIGLGFVAVAVLMLLASWLGWPGALLLVGGIFLVGAAIFTVVKMRGIQK